MPAPLISTKFHLPPASADIIARPQLFTRLEQGLHQPLTLVSAPPGFGKTMLVADWIHRRAMNDALQTVWLSIDESDNENGTFWRYFIAAIQRAYPQVGETAQAMLVATTPPDIQVILGSLINELDTLDAPLLIVLDDFHFIRTGDILNNLAFFLDHLPANVHLAVLTREDAPLGLARRRARRQMVEIRAADLRFDLQEISMFINQTYRLNLTPAQIDTLEQRTEGWAAGLQMAAISLQGRDVQSFFESFRGDDRYIADYLIEEVLQRQSETVRSFLLKTSILERLSPPLCAALTGDPTTVRETLDYLERANLFIIPLDNHRQWYRYHQLFAELLRQRLRETHSAAEIASLHLAASAWCESQGYIFAAIRHARQIPDDERILHLLENNAQSFFESRELPQFFEAAKLIPPALRQISPYLCISAAWAGLASGRFHEVAEWLQVVENYFGIPAEAALNGITLDIPCRAALLEVLVVRLQLPGQRPAAQQKAHILSIRSQLNLLPADQLCILNPVMNLIPVIAFNLGLIAEQMDEPALAAQTLTEAVALSRERWNSNLYHLSVGHLTNVQIVQGKLHAAQQTHEQALEHAKMIGQSISPYISLSLAGLGALHYEWNQLTTAEQYFDDALRHARLWNQWESLVPITIGRARLKQRAGDTRSALTVLSGLDSPPLYEMKLPIEAYAALLRASIGEKNSAAVWLSTAVSLAELEPTPANEPYILDIARLLASLNRKNEAIALIQNTIRFAEAGGRFHTLIQAKVAMAKMMFSAGDVSTAHVWLIEAIRLAEPEGYISTFVDEGETMRHLLFDLKGKIPSELRAYVDRILSAYTVRESLPGSRETGSGVALSEREREVLSLIVAGLSNQEIAERLVISITTVKTHIGNIFNKLGVTSRTQAHARAEELGLLPPH